MQKAIFFAVILLTLPLPVSAALLPQGVRKALDRPAMIQGYPCAKGHAWFYANGHLKQCSLWRETAFGEALAPAGSIIILRPDGKPAFLLLSHAAWIAGNQCAGGSWLGPAEGSSTAFYPSGKLKQCFLAEDQLVQGVPCMNGGFFGDGRGGGVKFYESGKLQSCKLTKDFGSQRRGERFVQGQ
jgi:antitoxin component YwqK of YwqJK toxin-antitoxin module